MSDPKQERIGGRVRWLHLSDLHLGCRGEELWWTVRGELRRHVAGQVEAWGGPPELVVLTGDLAFSGASEQYALVDAFLDALLGWLGDPEPLVVAVPGNHDLARPSRRQARALFPLRRYGDLDDPDVQDLRAQFWEEHDVGDLAARFAAYEAWAEARVHGPLARRAAAWQRSHFPGDWSAVVEVGGLRLGLVGLNSAWAQIDDTDFERRIELEAAQLVDALPRDEAGAPLALAEACDAALLLLHHPRRWLSPRARSAYHRDVYPARRFAACLHGHLHAGRTEWRSVSGGPGRLEVQAPSLLGLERYGTNDETRAMGCLWGELHGDGRVLLRPLALIEREGGAAFDRDPAFEGLDADGWLEVRPPDAERATTPGGTPEAPPEVDAGGEWDDYLRWADERHGRLDLVGFGAGQLRLSLDEVYVPLMVSARPPRLGGRGKERRAEEALAWGQKDLELDEAFSFAAGKEQAVFGDPGAGKTTALKKLLHQVVRDGAAAVGLQEGTVPAWLPLRRLTAGDLGRSPAAALQRELDRQAPGEFAGLGEGLWRRDHLLLLLDGLDEVPDAGLRAAICDWLDRTLAAATGRGVRAAVSCRYAGHGGKVRLSDRFLTLDVRPLDAGRVRRLVRAWFTAAGRKLEVDPARWPDADRESGRKAGALLEALESPDYSAQRLKVLVGNPLLLTLLCLVVVQGGEIPRQRAQFYAECLRVLLGKWKRGEGHEPLLAPADALTILRPLAYRLHAARRRDDLTGEELARVASGHLDLLARKGAAPRTPEEVLRWLHAGAGVLAEYGEDRWGFAHLGLQEYLAAVHVASVGGALLDDLADRFGEEWWREVTLLALGLPEHRVFGPLLRRVLKGDALAEQADLLRRCLQDAHVPDGEPFAEVLRSEAPAASKATVLRLFVGRTEPAVREAARGLVDARGRDVRELARAVSGWRAEEEEVLAERGELEVGVEDVLGIRLLEVPGGDLEMGADDITDDQRPVHRVRLSPFLLAETPVTNAQYARFLAATSHAEPPYWRNDRFSAPEQPVVTVSWHDAVAFCEWLSGDTGRRFLLPSEAQWEWAARGPDGRPYPWGPKKPTAGRACFGRSREKDRPDPVGAHPAGRGPFGHLDLAGNVWEWCADVWDAGAYGKRAGGEPPRDPVVLEGQEPLRALRGGAWLITAVWLRSAYRSRFDADDVDVNIGFRLASPPGSTVR